MARRGRLIAHKFLKPWENMLLVKLVNENGGDYVWPQEGMKTATRSLTVTARSAVFDKQPIRPPCSVILTCNTCRANLYGD
jgi:hypothetical protein